VTRPDPSAGVPEPAVLGPVPVDAAEVVRLELAAARALPARDVVLDDGWWLRADDDVVVRRANAVFAGAPGADPLGRKLDRAERWYGERRRPVRFQLSPASLPDGLLAALRSRGYRFETPVLVMTRDLEPAGSVTVAGVRLGDHADPNWAAAFAAALPVAEVPARSRLAREAPSPRAFATLADEACGVAVLGAGLVGVFDVATAPSARRRGHARRITAALLAWAAASGARRAYLQVAEGNAAARALYEGLGFRPAYRYVYAVRSAGGGPLAPGQ
jgi:N-acetylglutamate synthase